MSLIKVNDIQTTGGLSNRGKILQVVSTLKTDTYGYSGTSWQDVTGMSATITPSSTSSRIIIQISLGSVGNADAGVTLHSTIFRINRSGSTLSSIGDAASTRDRCHFRTSTGYNADHSHAYHFTVIDSPSSTSSLTYQLQAKPQQNTAWYLNRSRSDADTTDVYGGRSSSSIILYEVAN
jgi:hypothetical protein